MAEKILNVKIALVNKTTDEWNAETKIPFKGCPCIEFTVDGKAKLKIGDGKKSYLALPYVEEGISSEVIISALGYTPISNEKTGAVNGIATLNEKGQVTTAQLPLNRLLPEIGETDEGKIIKVVNGKYQLQETNNIVYHK